MLFEGDSVVTAVIINNDPATWKLQNKDGSKLTSVNYAGLKIDFANRDSIYGTSSAETIKFDTTVIFDPSTKKEQMLIDTIISLETLKSCRFTKNVK